METACREIIHRRDGRSRGHPRETARREMSRETVCKTMVRDARMKEEEKAFREETAMTDAAVMIRDRDARMKEEERASREETATTDAAAMTRDRDVHSKEEEKVSREETVTTEEITGTSATKISGIKISATRIHRAKEITDAVMTEENQDRPFLHLQLQNRNRAVPSRRMLIRKKSTEMMRMKTECQRGKRERIILLSRN